MKSKLPENKLILPVLAIETSGELCSASILFSETEFGEISIQKKHVHSEKLIQIVEKLFDVNDLQLEDISAIAISSGPGSFTGLRIGMSVAKGIAFGSGKPLVPVPTFSALALQISSFIQKNKKFYIVMNANIDEVYLASFEKTGDFYKTIDEPELLLKSELEQKIEKNSSVYGNFSLPERHCVRLVAPRAEFISKWAFFFGKDLLTSNYDYLEPTYLKDFIPKVKK